MTAWKCVDSQGSVLDTYETIAAGQVEADFSADIGTQTLGLNLVAP